MSQEFKIENMPIFWREAVRIEPSPGIPSQLDLKIVGGQSWGGISIEATRVFLETLELIYRADENIGYLQDDNPLADIYAPEYINFIQKHVAKNSRISEIGAGGCYSLQRLKHLGYSVTAIDPSPVCVEAGKKYEIDVLPEFFPSQKGNLLNNADVCIHYDVLEHVVSPQDFLSAILSGLPEGGRTIFVVPDSTLHIQQVDLSMCLHQHLNYFSDISLRNLVTRAGFKIVELSRSNSTGTIYCCAEKVSGFQASGDELKALQREVDDQTVFFFQNAESIFFDTVKSIARLLEKDTGTKLGFYPPIRAVPFLSSLVTEFRENIVFIDDNTKVQGRYICDLDFPIYSRDQAVKNGVKNIVICSKPFKCRMTQKLIRDNQISEEDIYYLDELNNMDRSHDN